jgi:hypothetical protein
VAAVLGGRSPPPHPSPIKGEGVEMDHPSPMIGEGAKRPQPSPIEGEGATGSRPSPIEGRARKGPVIRFAYAPPSPSMGEGGVGVTTAGEAQLT